MKRIKRRNKNKIFHDNRCRKLNASRWKDAQRKNPQAGFLNDSNRIVLQAPKELSVFDATETSLRFFENVMDRIKHCKVRATLYFDLSHVETITPDAVMYLIAIINNTKKLRVFHISCEGNMPQNPMAREVFQNTVFLSLYMPHIVVN